MVSRGMTQTLSERYHDVRRRTRQIFDLIAPDAFDMRPIPLRHPLRFYEGHLASFNVGMLLQSGFLENDQQPDLTTLFARGIDPLDTSAADKLAIQRWPERGVVADYITRVENEMERAFESEIDPIYLHTAVEHEEMHQETLAYMWHRLPYRLKSKPEHYRTLPPRLSAGSPRAARVRIPEGTATLGTGVDEKTFAWDNELPAHSSEVPAFEVDGLNVTNADFMAFVDAGGYGDPRWWRKEDWAWVQEERVTHPTFWEHDTAGWHWLAMFERVPLPPDWPVYVTWAEAHAYARWRGARLLTEAEFHRAAFATPSGRDRRYPWGETLDRAAERGNFDFARFDPLPVGAFPGGASGFGVQDLVGNGWEWTSDVFAPFDGFTPLPSYPEYSADFFDGQHFVLKGASPMTARGLVRPGFRNWFRPRYPYVYATFRCAQDV